MIRLPRSILVVAVTFALALGTSGCAKRPAVAVATAPAPTGAATPPAPLPAPAQPAPPPVATAPAAAEPTRPEPAAAPVPRPAPAEFGPNDALRMIHFEFDKADIRPDDASILEANARWLRDNPGHIVLVQGHCDERGTNEYNLALGERRARSAMNFLVAQGVASARFTVVSYGEERPLCREESETCWAQNRRAMFFIKPQ